MRLRMVSRGTRYMRPTKVRYSRAVRLSNNARSSGMTPTRLLAFSASFGLSMFFPRTSICPREGAKRPVSILMVVDLPAPFGPRKP